SNSASTQRPTRDEDDAAAAVIRRPPAVPIRSGYAVAHSSGCNRRRCPTSRKVWTRDRRDELESVASRRQLGRRSRFETWLCPGFPRREGLYFLLTRSERLGPEVRLVGAPIVA